MDYERLLKLARDGDISVALELLEAAIRHNRPEHQKLAVELHCRRSNLHDLESALHALFPLLKTQSALQGVKLPSFSEGPPVALDQSVIVSWDEDYVLAFTGDALDDLVLMDPSELLEHQLEDELSEVGNLRALDALLTRILTKAAQHSDDLLMRVQEVLPELVPSFGNGSEPERCDPETGEPMWDGNDNLVSWSDDEVLLYQGRETHWTNDFRGRYIHHRDDYESGYE